MTVRASLGQLFVRNWPIKLAALFFAIMLYVAVAAQQPLTQSFALRLAIGIPPGRTVRQQPAGVTVEAESGFVLRGLSITPSLAHLVGPEKSLAKFDSVTTLPTVISSVSGPFFQTVPIDTTPLGVVRISPKTVRMAGEVTAIIERSIGGLPITKAAPGFHGLFYYPC